MSRSRHPSAPNAVSPDGARPLAPYGRCGPHGSAVAGLAELIYELLDAHADTAELASELELDGAWLAHLDYLRGLQRHGRRVLARMGLELASGQNA